MSVWVEQFNREAREAGERAPCNIRAQEHRDSRDDLTETLLEIGRSQADGFRIWEEGIAQSQPCPVCGRSEASPYCLCERGGK